MKITNILAFLLKSIILSLRPLLGPDARCKFTLTCTPYAIHVLETQPLIPAIKSIIHRLWLCKPF